MLASYHNHTNFSDGKTSVSELIEAAKSQGIAEVGISDHLTLHPKSKPPKWSMKPDILPEYVAEVCSYKNDSSINVRLGIELDWFNDNERVLSDVIESHPFDYIIGSVHFVGSFAVDGNPHRWEGLSQKKIDEIHSEYWIRMKNMAKSGLFDIAAHLDLPKKFNCKPTIQPWDLIEEALAAIADANVIVELNTAGWHKKCRDAYPSIDILKRSNRRGIGVTLSSDAHTPDDLLRDFDRGATRLREAGYASVARFNNRKISYVPLDQAVSSVQ